MKRILALDGGGIRGVFSLMVLKRIEELFRAERGRADLVLRDEFDFFVGTSTGAIIATFLAWGYRADEILQLYEQQGRAMFSRAGWFSGLYRNKYQAQAITHFFKSHFQEPDGTPAKLGTERLRTTKGLTYLMVIMRNATTGSPWPVTNNPRAKYSEPGHPECNLQIPIWQLLRASTAAPTFFPPEQIVLGSAMRVFVDGGLTPFNNPALIAALTATLPQYHMNWPTGTDQLQVVSIGTGSDPAELPAKHANRLNKLDFARYIAPAMIESVASEQDMLCRILGDCLAGDVLNREIYDLRGPGPDLLTAPEKKFSYVRYNVRLRTRLSAAGAGPAENAFALDDLDLIPLLKERGTAFAETAVKRGHFFPPFERDPAQRPASKFAPAPAASPS